MRTKEEAEKKTIYNTETGQHMNVKGNVADDIVGKLDKWKYGTAPTTGKVWIHHPENKVKLQVTPERFEELKSKGWKTSGELKGGYKEGQEYTISDNNTKINSALRRISEVTKSMVSLGKGGGVEEAMQEQVKQRMLGKAKTPEEKAKIEEQFKSTKLTKEQKDIIRNEYKKEIDNLVVYLKSLGYNARQNQATPGIEEETKSKQEPITWDKYPAGTQRTNNKTKKIETKQEDGSWKTTP